MADDNNQRPYRQNETRATPQATPASGNDPLAELARLIGQSDPFAEFGRDARRPAPASPPSADWNPSPANAPAYVAAQPAPATQPELPAQPFGAPNFESQPYGAGSYAAGAGLYRTDNSAAGFAGAAAPTNAYTNESYYQHDQLDSEDDDLYDDAPPRRRMGVIAIAAVFALAVLGTASAIGYRAIFGSSSSNMPPPVIKADTTPSKVVPATASKDAPSNKTITDRVGDTSRNEKLVSREERPVEMKDQIPPMAMAPGQGVQPSAPLMPANGSGVVAAEPKKIRTIIIHPDQVATTETPPAVAVQPPARAETQPGPSPVKPASPPAPRVVAVPPPAVAEPKAEPALAPAVPEPRPPAVARNAPAAAPAHRAAPSNAPLSLNPGDSAPAPAASPPARAAPPASSAGGYAVQVSAQRSEADAEAAFKSMQAKYPDQLGGRAPIIHRVDLGAKGIYFRALVGPFASSAEAGNLCSSLKSAGGQCLVQKN